MTAASRRSSRLVRRSMAAISRRGLQFVRRASFGGVFTASMFAAGEVSAQVNIPPDQTATATDAPNSSSLGSQTINFTGAGTLNLNGQGVGVSNRLQARWFNDEQGVAFLNPISNLINATSEGTNELAGPLNLLDDAGFNAAQVGLVDLETFSTLWTGFMNVTTAGTHQFRTGSDDGSVWWIDRNRDGTFGAGELVVDHNRDQGYVASPVTSIDLAVGNYPIAIGFYENGGGNRMEALFRRPADAALQFVDPSAGGQTGIWSYIQNQTRSADFSTNPINFTASGTVNVDAVRSAEARVGAVTMSRGLTVTTNGSRLVAPSTTITAAGTGNATFAGTGAFVAGTVNTSGNAINFVSAGTGSGGLNLNRVVPGIAAGSTLAVTGGRASLAVAAGTTPIGDGAITLSGGTLAITNDLSVANGPGVFNITGSFYQNGFEVSIVPNGNGGWTGLDSKAAFDAVINGFVDPNTTLATMPINVPLNWPAGALTDGGTNDNPGVVFDNITAPASLVGNSVDPWIARFAGKLNVTAAGPTDFHVGSNDGAVLFLDTDLGPGTNWQKVADNNRSWQAGAVGEFDERGTGNPGVFPTITQLPAQNLSVGVYDFVVGMYNTTVPPDNDEGGLEVFWVPSGGTRSIIPYAAGGPVTLNNIVTVSGNSGLEIQAPSATLAGLRMNPGSSLLVSGAPLTTSVTATGAGTVTVGSFGGTVNLTELIDGGNAVNFSAGPGRVILSRTGGPGPGFGATSSVGASTGGTLVVTNDSAGATGLAGAPVMLTGGTLELNVRAISGGPLVSGLREGRVAGAFNITTPSPEDRGIRPGPVMAEVVGGNNIEPWPDNITYVYTGQMFFPDNGTPGDNVSEYAFAEHVDDSTQIKVDGLEVLNNNVWNAVNSTGARTISAGWHDIEFRFGEGTGGAGPSTDTTADADPANPWDLTLGLGVDFTSPIEGDLKQPNYTAPRDNGTMNVFRTTGFVPPNFQSNVTASENSTINVVGVTGAQIGSVGAAAGKTLTVTGNELRVNGSIEGAGTVRAASNTTIEFVKNGAASSGSPSLGIVRTATMEFAPGAGNTFGGTAVTAISNEGRLHAMNGITDMSNAVVTTTNVPGTVISGGLSNVSGDFYDTFAVPIAQNSVNTFGWSGLDSKAQFDTALAGKTTLATRPLNNLPINFPRGNASLVDGGTNDLGVEEIFNVDGAALNVPLTGNTDFVVRFTGKLNVANAGPTDFLLLSNDGAALFLDLDQGAGTNWQKIVDNNRFTGTGGAAMLGHYTGSGAAVTDQNLTVDAAGPVIPNAAGPNLAVGSYDFAVGFFNANANEAGIELYWTPAGGTRSIIPVADVSGPTVVQVDAGATLRLGALVGANDVNVNGRLELHGPTTSKVLTLNIAGATGAWTGTVDMTDADLVYQSTTATKTADFNRMYDQLKSGFAGGVWTGNGITSSTAATNPTADTGLSLVDNALLGATTFSGQTVSADSILLKYTYYGDIDMNGQVDGDDLTTFALNFGRTSGMTQVDGDIDFNGRVDGEDLTVFALNFNKGIGNPLAAGSVAAVPEPASLVLAGLGAAGALVGLVVRRRR